MAEHLLLVEQAGDWQADFPSMPVVTAREYLSQGVQASRAGAKRRVRIINLCRSYRYLSLGYYCSLLAEARGHKVVPNVNTIQELSSRALYGLAVDALNARVPTGFAASANQEGAVLTLVLMFGQCDLPELQTLARDIFETFRCPLLRVELRYQQQWRIASLRALSFHSLTVEQENAFFAALEQYLSRPWRQPRARPEYRYDLAILHDPKEDLPPSNAKALQRFVRAGRQLQINVELIQRRDYGRLAEYDALLIRETTRIGHYSFRFAKKAASEGLVVIDDPESILRCTNKVFLAELLEANRVPRPRTLILRKENLLEAESRIGYPVVLKIPEGSFSRGVFKAADRGALLEIAGRLLRESDLILAQEFLYTAFDWRIGVLAQRPLYACQYFMSKAHWQIVHHHADGRHDEGRFATVALAEAPPAVVELAVRAANLIGDGLYGVDVKETTRGPVVIEINDNPNLDAGVEDRVLGDELYRRILGEMVGRLERRRSLRN